MCGIAGAVNRNIPDTTLRSLHHRGPDASGEISASIGNNRIWLGHTRLSILDLSDAGAQPMASSDGRWLLTFNGEIYNHLAIRSRLSVPFRGHSDTETIVESLAAFGVEATLAQLNGMYAFAALDRTEGKLYLCRDPFGIKPLYYVSDSGSLGFASEIRALREMGHDLSVDPDGLSTFLSLRYVPSPRTLLENVSRLPPGHILTYDVRSGNLRCQAFIRPQTSRFVSSMDSAVSAYQRELKEAVQRQLLSDVPVGVLLSGGIDSALVAAMARESGRVLTGFTVGFGTDHDECEIDDAAHTARVLGMPHRSVTVTPDMLWDCLPDIVRSVEEPLGTTSIMPMWYLVKLAREEVTVVLTGQGSDEPWGGYRRYQQELMRRFLPQPAWSLAGLASGLADKRAPDFVRRGLRSISESSVADRFLLSYELFTATERRQLTGDDGCGEARTSINNWLSWLGDSGLSPAEQQMRIDTRMNLADDLLLYGDKISMAVALEARVPMLDIRLMEFVESLPRDYKARLRKTKIVHKKMAEQYLPSEIVHRRKKGFNVPFGDWCRGEWKEKVSEVLLAGGPHLDLLSREKIEQLWRQHLAGRPDRSRQIFSLLMLALWARSLS